MLGVRVECLALGLSFPGRVERLALGVKPSG